MESVILITDKHFTLDQLSSVWRNKSISINRINDRLAIELPEGRIYADLIVNGRDEYVEEEIKKIDIDLPVFYSISYSNSVILKLFLGNSMLKNYFYIDDDHGGITLFNEFLNRL